VGSRDLWLADRNFCITSLLFGIAAGRGCFVIRQHGSTLAREAVGDRVSHGRSETGAVFEQKLKLTNGAGDIFFVRRVMVELDNPTRDGDRSIHILTNLPADDAGAITVAKLYRGRWTLEISHPDYPSSCSLYRGSRAA
jgi:hypothetical protein